MALYACEVEEVEGEASQGTVRMIRVLAALLGLLLGLLGFASPAEAARAIPSAPVHAYSYDVGPRAAPVTDTANERGPSGAVYDYDPDSQLVQVGSDGVTTHKDAPAAVGQAHLVSPAGVAANTGSVSSRVASHLDEVKGIASNHGVPLNKFGDGYLWANKEANLVLRTPEQVAAVQARGFTPSEVTKIRDYYQAVDEASSGANPSASHRADLMQYYLDNWGG